MKIIILGNGGAINNGLHYNSFLIDNQYLCELPPDIMFTLHDAGIDIEKITKVFISHFHGDHTFGFPFFILHLFSRQITHNLEIYGPKNCQNYFRGLLINAFANEHPCLAWMDNKVNFVEINEQSDKPFIEKRKVRYFKLEHLVETFGFSIYSAGSSMFSYIADTVWTGSIEKILSEKPKCVIIDLNGCRTDPVKVHISIDDIAEKGLSITGKSTVYYGTHLKDEFKDSNLIRCAKYKMELEIEDAGQ